MEIVKKSYRKTEVFLFSLGLLSSLTYLIFTTKRIFIGELLLGYFLFFFIFIISTELFFIIESKTKIKSWGYIILTNLKLVIISILIYTAHLASINALNLIIGFLACQIMAVVSLLKDQYSQTGNIIKAKK